MYDLESFWYFIVKIFYRREDKTTKLLITIEKNKDTTRVPWIRMRILPKKVLVLNNVKKETLFHKSGGGEDRESDLLHQSERYTLENTKHVTKVLPFTWWQGSRPGFRTATRADLNIYYWSSLTRRDGNGGRWWTS